MHVRFKIETSAIDTLYSEMPRFCVAEDLSVLKRVRIMSRMK